MISEIQSCARKRTIILNSIWLIILLQFQSEQRFDELWKKVSVMGLEGLAATSTSALETFDENEFFKKISYNRNFQHTLIV